MWAIKDKKTGEFVKRLYRDDGLGLPDLLMIKNANDAKIYKTKIEADNLVNRFKEYGSPLKLEVIRVWGRIPN